MTEVIEENSIALRVETILALIDEALASVAHKSIVSAGEIADVLLDIRSYAGGLLESVSAKEQSDDKIVTE